MHEKATKDAEHKKCLHKMPGLKLNAKEILLRCMHMHSQNVLVGPCIYNVLQQNDTPYLCILTRPKAADSSHLKQ